MPLRDEGSDRNPVRWVQGWFSAAVETIAPSVCIECGAFAARGWVCDACFSAGRRWDDTWCHACGLPADHGHAPFCRTGRLPEGRSQSRQARWSNCRGIGAYAGFLRTACLSAKQPANAWLFPPLAREWWLVHGAWAASLGHCLLAPIPRHWTRRLSTGHDPAYAFARALQRIWTQNQPDQKVQFVPILRRARATPKLAPLDVDARARTVQDIFTVRFPQGFQLEEFDRVVLVDDIATTCATAQAAALAVHRAGLKKLELAVIARTLEGRL